MVSLSVNGYLGSPAPSRRGREQLKRILGDRVVLGELLSKHTSYRVGGPADAFATASSPEDLAQLVLLARDLEVPCFVMGAGTNLLVSDRGIRGLVVHNRSASITTEFLTISNGLDEGSVWCVVRADSGALLSRLAHYTGRLGLTGLEWADGIPGTVGGAIVGNAGAFGENMSQIVREVTLLTGDGSTRTIEADGLGFGYRTSELDRGARDGEIVLTAALLLRREAVARIEARMSSYREQRMLRQPRGASAGSVFRNPPGDYAGRLIEQAGLKGLRVGDAQVSELHANFAINLGHSSAEEILSLITTIRERVLERFGIALELEIRPVGDWPPDGMALGAE